LEEAVKDLEARRAHRGERNGERTEGGGLGEVGDLRLRLALRRRQIQRKAAEPGGAEAAKPDGGAEPKGAEPEGASPKQPDVVRPLDDGVRQKMEAQFNADFSQVKIHTGADADRKAAAIGAVAFTEGSDIYFRDGAYDPTSAKGLTLLAHELTHVVQQGAAPTKGDADVKPGAAGETKEGDAEAKGSDKKDAKDEKDAKGAEAAPAAAPTADAPQAKPEAGDVSQPGDPAEREADQVAAQVASGEHVSVGAAPSAGVHRSPGPPPGGAPGAAPSPAKTERVEVQIPGMTITIPVDQLDKALRIKGAYQGPLTPALQEIANVVAPEVKPEVQSAVQESRQADQEVAAANQELGHEPAPPPEKRAGWRARLTALLGRVKDFVLRVATRLGLRTLSPDEARNTVPAQSAATNNAAPGGPAAQNVGAPANNSAPGAPASPGAESGQQQGPQQGPPLPSIFPQGAFSGGGHGPEQQQHGAAPPEGNQTNGAMPDLPDPLQDPATVVARYKEKGGWNALRNDFKKDEPRMRALTGYRERVVNQILDGLVAKQQGKIGYESNGSSTPTSDYDLSIFDKGTGQGNPAIAVKEFNDTFRAQFGMESGTVFDTNVYDKGDAMPIKGVETDPVIVEAQSRAEVGNDAIQDVAALVKVRRYMPDDEKGNPTKSTAWDQYVIRVQGAVTDAGQRAAFVERAKLAQKQYEDSETAIAAKIQELMNAGGGGNADDIRLQASNALYAAELAKVQALRQKRIEEVAAYKDEQNPRLKERHMKEIERLTLEIKSAMSMSLNFANEAYNSEGALLDIVGNQQGALAAALQVPGAQKKLTDQEKLSSFNEQYGDALKDLQHYGAEPETCGVQVSKYLVRFIKVGKEICEDNKENPEAGKQLGILAAMEAPNAQLKEMRADAKKDRSNVKQLMKQVAGETAAEYADKLTNLNIAINGIARG
jgi:FtsZ-binding cell division protein ZapB